MDLQAEKYSIKNMLFTKIIPNYVIPIPTKGYKVYGCTDCGDKFLFQSSYNYHVNRKSLQITFTCRICNTRNIFYNRCTLLAHIRSHAFKTATININDIIIEPLPLTHFKTINQSGPKMPISSISTNTLAESYCLECKVKLKVPLSMHLMDNKSNQTIMCPLCAFTVPTMCGLTYHLRLHLEKPPLICPECGVHIRTKRLMQSHNRCLGFHILRANRRFRCEVTSCSLLYRTDEHKEHLKKYHIKNVFKCPLCVVACFSGPMMEHHMQSNHAEPAVPIIFYQCDLCPGRLVLESQLSYHLMGHEGREVYPCRTCGKVYLELLTLIKHYIDTHGRNQKEISIVLSSMLSSDKYSVVKKCEKCHRYFTYKCAYDDIDDLPTDCPYDCSKENVDSQNSNKDVEIIETNVTQNDPVDTIKCYLCKFDILNDWSVIKKHFYFNHRNIKCVDVKVNLKRIDLSKTVIHKIEKYPKRNRSTRRKRNIKSRNDVTIESSVICKKCEKTFDTKELLMEHIISHRDQYMAYQCMECGDCFAVKPSFCTHLLIEHNIADPEDYITKHQCYNKDALLKNDLNPPVEGPLKEHQCNICREQFSDTEELEKHYRVHGMAFLKKNTSNNSNSSSP